MQAVLQAAYLRQLLGVPPAGSRHPPAAASAATGNGRGLDKEAAVAESAQLARSSLKPFISQVGKHSVHIPRALRCAGTVAA